MDRPRLHNPSSAYHEAGHAVVLWHHGIRFRYVTLRPRITRHAGHVYTDRQLTTLASRTRPKTSARLIKRQLGLSSGPGRSSSASLLTRRCNFGRSAKPACHACALHQTPWSSVWLGKELMTFLISDNRAASDTVRPSMRFRTISRSSGSQDGSAPTA
jgi:hypothetical protein